MFRSRPHDSPPPRYDSLELDHELSRSYDDVVDASARDRLVLDVAHDDHDSAHAFVRFQSPRSLQDTAARVANIVQQHHQTAPSDSTRSSSPLPSPTPTPLPAPAPSRPHLRSMRSLAQLRSQRQVSMASDKSNGSNPSTTSHENGSDRSRDDAYVPLRSQSHHHDCHGHGHGSSGNTQTAMLHCPSSHYYIDAQGHLQVRRTWWLYTRVRRLMGHLLPGFKRDDNTFLCAPMITNTTLILTIYVLRVLLNDALLTALLSPDQQKECHEFSSEFLDFFSFSLLGNTLLCIPAFNLSMFKLFRRVKPEASCESKNKTPQPPPPVHGGALGIEPLGGVDATGAPVATAAAADGAVVHDDDHPRLKKTYLFTACELLVIVEIPYLVYIFLTMFIPAAAIAESKATHSDLWSVSARCANALSSGVFLAFVLAQTIGILAYVLRWKQIIIFHRMHEHFLFQRGCVPGRARFDYVEQSFGVSWFASAHTKRVHAIKSRLYHAAKYGDLDQVRAQLEAATLLDGPDFAHKWYENTGFLERVFGRRFVKCQRNPLHVAVAFDNAEIVEELLSNGMFDIHELEKMELLKVNVSWIYRFFFDIVPFLRMSNYSRHQTRLVFGPTGLFCSTLLTPLHVAVSMGNTDMVLLLLRFGADPNRSAASSHRKFVTPPLFWAINKECTRLLLDADANPVFVPGRGYFLTAFEVARLVGNHAVAMEIEKYGGDVALTPLHDAAARGLKNEVRFYLEHGANPDTFGEKVTGFFRRTPLHWAAIRGEAKVVKLLLKYGADLDAKDAFGRTALTWACLLNRVKTVQVLLKFGADVDIRDIQGDPLLCILAAGTCSSPSSEAFTSDAHRHDTHRRMTRTEHDAAGAGRNDYTTSQTAKTLDPDIFEMLQRSGIDIHATREANGDTALHVALRKNNEATAILLVRAGMSLTAVNYVGQRAMDCTTSSSLRYAIKKEAGHRDVMISYTHSHSALARKVRDALEGAYVTTWIDSMDPSGITGGSVWRQEIAQGIRSSALVLALLTTDYPMSQWCMKELAFAKMHNVPIVAIQCENMQMTEELQVYLWTRQIVDFRAAFGERVVEVVDEADDIDGERGHAHLHDMDDDEALLAVQDPRDAVEGDGAVARPKVVVQHEYDDETFHNCIRLLLDGIHDQIEEHRVRRAQRQQRQKMLLRARATVQEDDVPLSSDEDDGLDDGDAGGLCGITPRNLRANADLAETDHDGVVLDEPLAMSPASRDRGAFVFIAHGDYHLQFCQRLRNALQKNGVQCILDQSVPSIQYGGSLAPTSAASHTTSPRRLNRLQSNVTVQSGGGGYGSGSDVATTTAHARQLAAKDAILECSAVIVVLSPISSKCDMLADQLAFAEDRGKLIVPLMLSLQTIDLAKRYTFSRSVVQHFNVSIGFDQSLERLVVYLMQTAEAMQRQQQQKDAAFQHQLRLARRQRRKERARRRRRRDGLGTPSQAGSEEDENDDDDDELDAVSPASSPASSVRSAVRVLSPSHFNMLPPPADGSGLPPTIPILQPTRQPSTGATSGHGWSVTPAASSAGTGGGTGGLVRQSSLGPVGDSTPRQQQRESRHHFGTEPLLRRTTSMQAPARSDHTSGDL